MMKSGDRIKDLLRRFRNAQKRARYWSGTPSFGSNRYVPGRVHKNRDMEYEMAMNDQESLSSLLADEGCAPCPKVIDYKRQFAVRLSAMQTKLQETK